MILVYIIIALMVLFDSGYWIWKHIDTASTTVYTKEIIACGFLRLAVVCIMFLSIGAKP